MSNRKPTSAIVEIRNANDELVQEVDVANKKIIYHISKKSKQSFSSKITVLGFVRLPAGFYSSGFGLTSAGNYFLRACAAELGDKFELTITRDGVSEIRETRGKKHVFLNHGQYASLLAELRVISLAKSKESREITQAYVASWYPGIFKSDVAVTSSFSYRDDRISKILNSEENVIEKLSKNDITKILEIYPSVVKRVSGGKATSNIAIISASKAEADKVVLSQLIAEYERRLGLTQQNENDWQKFLQQNILLFNTSYVAVLEKNSVSLQGKYPDFMLVDVFNYIDIFEIKRPNTNLLKHDESRNNYYWDTEISKAIVQVENYINSLGSNGATFERDLKKSAGLEVAVVKPRGVIIAGTRSQLKNAKMKDDFRLLKNALKNIDLILFDDFVDRLKNLSKRLET
nr:Shedu immune nuclease family protein [uncultured Bdellovibrio sp.]